MTTLAREQELASADRAARRRACEQFDRPLVVEAGAGTGKTTTLVARIVTWCVGAGWKRAAEEVLAQDRARSSIPTERAQEEGLAPDRTRASTRARFRQADLFADADDVSPAQAQAIAERVLAGLVAITFTEAAAAEMGRRIRQALARLERGETPAGMYANLLPDAALTQRRARALAAVLDRLVVLTIHAWCQSLLSEFPLEAGLSPDFSVDAEGLVIADAAREVLEARLVAALGDPPEPDYLTLARRGFGPRAIEDALLTLARAGVRASDLADDPLTPERSRAFVADFTAEIEGFLARFAIALRATGKRSKTTLDVLERLAQSAARARSASVDSPAALNDLCTGLRELWTDGARKRIDDWAKGKWTVAESHALADAPDDVQVAAAALAAAVRGMCRLDPELLACGRRVVADLLGALRTRLRARGVEGFPDLLRDARDLLRDHPDVRRRVRRRMRQICVDEFQDTDPLQCDLIRLAVLDPIAGERADAQAPGLFLVGDPKQSIYGWRNADLGAYEGTVADVLARGGERVRLSTNFRSTRRILAEVERAIRPVMQATSGVQPDFEALIAARDVAGARVEHWVSWELDRAAERRLGKTLSEDACALEARLIARDILAARGAREEPAMPFEGGDERRVEWGEIAILLRAGSAFDVYLEALREAQIPYEVVGDRSYFRRREIIDAAALVRCVIDPTDHVALLSVLRSAWVGTPDAALLPLWNQGFPALITDLACGDPASLAPVEAAIERALALVPDDVPGIERIAGWPLALKSAVAVIGSLRRSFREDPADTFVERLRTASLIEATESARYLGMFRLANLERFFGRLLAGLEQRAGDARAILRALKHALSEARDAEEARPQDDALDAVQVMTIHKAKGLEFERVYVAALHRGHGGDALPLADVDLRGGEAQLALFGSATPGYARVEARRREVEAAERVRTLYVAMTRAKEGLVLAGRWPDVIRARGWRACETHLDLLAASAPADLPAHLHAALDGAARCVELEDALYVLPPDGPIVLAREVEADASALDVAAVERSGLALAERRRAALARMDRPLATDARCAASAPAGAAELAADALDRSRLEAALRRAIHTGADLSTARQRFARDLSPEIAARAIDAFTLFVASPLLARLESLRSRAIASDVALWRAPGADDPALGVVRATVDFAWSDAGVDTIAVLATRGGSDAAPETARRGELLALAEAWRAALGRERDPRCELWLVDEGLVMTIA